MYCISSSFKVFLNGFSSFSSFMWAISPGSLPIMKIPVPVFQWNPRTDNIAALAPSIFKCIFLVLCSVFSISFASCVCSPVHFSFSATFIILVALGSLWWYL